ncbi:cytochrome c biogenesis heme-transporting ATPase CcmA [Thalassotalea litorea]|uniref:Cytochrome c biogenesis heme-transporting ATPase CcmA n=1 Tax=Thalassotalea litorea TaxID=2020715 RepID=A0A5R9IH19_9GAMM|nr:cytochrome c biogenesis heme-transporting ATPase CcmA [Thalassotalea litorea]TLU64805.1 cytochrome c biogenesis heme-transporting ATPase CcmA [Thalassotalea litorea]
MNTSSSLVLTADNLSCIREERILFDELDLQFKNGDIWQIAGANGTGKTSLLRILAGLHEPENGNIKYKGTLIGQCNEEYHQDLLYLGHSPGVKAELTVLENLQFNLQLCGQNTDQCVQLLEQVDLYGFSDTLAAHLSAGQHRRIALARLWLTDARIWILDEPFTAIDKQGVKRLEQRVLEHADQGGIVILTTHQDLSLPTSRYQTLTLERVFAL